MKFQGKTNPDLIQEENSKDLANDEHMSKSKSSEMPNIENEVEAPMKKLNFSNMNERIKNIKEKDKEKVSKTIDRISDFNQQVHSVITSAKTRYKRETAKKDPCINPSYPTGPYKNFFPEKTSVFKFNTSDNNCNLMMLQYILHDFDKEKYNNLPYYEIKNMIVESYNALHPSQYEYVYNKWAYQHKSQLLFKIIGKQLTFEDAIMSEDYQITEIDIVLLSDHYNIPIMIYLQTKGDIKLIYLDKFSNSEFMYILKEMKIVEFQLHVYEEGIKFHIENLHKNNFIDVIREKMMKNIDVYLKTELKEIKKKSKLKAISNV